MKTITYIASKKEDGLVNISLPVCIFSNGLSGLEAISKYLVEITGLRYCQIADLLNRDDRTIWDAHNGAKRKSHEDFSKEISSINIPIKIFGNRSLSILESLTAYLREEFNLRYCQIASLLNKDDRTIWTVYDRARKKRKNEELRQNN